MRCHGWWFFNKLLFVSSQGTLEVERGKERKTYDEDCGHEVLCDSVYLIHLMATNKSPSMDI
jgi:hypothetical protein